MEGSVGPSSGEGAVGRVEGDCVHTEDVGVCGAAAWLSVTLEGKVHAKSRLDKTLVWAYRGWIPGVFLVHVLDRAAALNATHREAARVRETADNARLPLQWALDGLEYLVRVLDVDDIDVSLRSTDNQQTLLYVHRVHPLLHRHSRRRLLLPHIPVLDRLVPRARHEHIPGLWVLNELDAANRLIVGRHLRGLPRLQVETPGSLVCTSRHDF